MSCQDRCIDMDYDGDTRFYREETRRAAKAHACCECGAPIAVGESHEYAIGASDGEFWDYRTCAACADVRAQFCCGAWIFGKLWDSIREQLFSGWDEMTAIDCLAKLTTDAAVAKMRAQYADYAND